MDNAGLFSTDGSPIPLRGVTVLGEVIGGFAKVTVRQRYENAERRPVEAIYTFPLPADATLVGFAMTCAGRRIDAVVKEREQAFKDYDDAVMDGHGAALLEQERANVFTASVGNLLPGEETLVELEYVQRVRADEGALRWMVPTVVAPRYMPGKPAGDRTAHGWADPTDRVPDADRISPQIGQVDYGLRLDLVFDLGRDVEVESPSHLITTTRERNRTRVAFRQGEVALDRDVVLIARGAHCTSEETLTTLAAHRGSGEPGFFALTVVPDLAGEGARAAAQDVVFLIDVSGSMEGASLPQAQAALKLCLRHLREGDRFNVIAFESGFTALAPKPVPFTQRTLDQADAWVDALAATGGTELLQPLLAAVRQAPDGVIVLLTDGQVGNEDEIAQQTLAARGRARVYSFGIGTAVSDALLRDLAKRTDGGVEFIHPGERIDEKVVATFARAVAPRIEGVKLSWEGIEVTDTAPADLPALVDGEPWVIVGRFAHARAGAAIVSGTRGNEPFRLRVPVDFADAGDRPVLAKLWATERIRDLEGLEVSGRREKRQRERIVELAVRYGVSSSCTAFLCVETRTGDRRASGSAEARPIPVNAPAGWGMFQDKDEKPREAMKQKAMFARGRVRGPLSGATRSASVGAPPPAPKAAAPARMLEALTNGVAGFFKRGGPGGGGYGRKEEGDADADEMFEAKLEAQPQGYPGLDLEAAPAEAEAEAEAAPADKAAADPVTRVLQEQLASGLWDEPGIGDAHLRQLRATTRALLALLRHGVTTAHALHGGQVKKALAALIPLAADAARRGDAASTAAAELALGLAWLVASGHRTRREIEAAVAAAPALSALKGRLGDEPALRRHVDQLAAP